MGVLEVLKVAADDEGVHVLVRAPFEGPPPGDPLGVRKRNCSRADLPARFQRGWISMRYSGAEVSAVRLSSAIPHRRQVPAVED